MHDVRALVRGFDPTRLYQIGEVASVFRHPSREWGKRNVAKVRVRLIMQNVPGATFDDAVATVLALTVGFDDAFDFDFVAGAAAGRQRVRIRAHDDLGDEMSASKRSAFTRSISRRGGVCEFVSEAAPNDHAEWLYDVDEESFENEPESTLDELRDAVRNVSNESVTDSRSRTQARFYLPQSYVERDLLSGLIPGSDATVSRDWSLLNFIDRLKE